MVAPEGGQYFEGERYRLWQKGETLTITAKNHRGEILRLENGRIQGNLSSEETKAFQIFDQILKQELAQASEQKSQNL